MMFLIASALRRLTRHWRLNLALLLGLSLAAALLAGLPSFAATTAASSLEQALEAAPPAERNIKITSSNSVLTASLGGYIDESIGDLVLERQRVQVAYLSGAPQIETVDGGERLTPNSLNLWAFSGLNRTARLITGEWPRYEPPEGNEALFNPPPLEGVVALGTAEQTGLQVGDLLETSDALSFRIVGIFERLEPDSHLWFDDESPFNLTILPGLNSDTRIVSLIVNPNAMAVFGGVEAYWRLLLDQSALNADNALEIEKGLLNLKSRVEVHHAVLESGLPNLLLEYRTNLSAVRLVMLLLSAQAYFFVLYTLFLIAALLLDRSRSEIASLAGRGASSLQITLVIALESLPLALLSGLLSGPGLAYLALLLWSGLTGELIPRTPPIESWYFSLAGAMFGWLSIVLPVFPTARKTILEWQGKLARPDKKLNWQSNYLDIFLLVLGGVIIWQLNRAGSFVLRQFGDTNLIDPLLLLGPSILLIALALIFLRLIPYLLRGLAWLVERDRGLILSLGLKRLARDPVRPSRVLLLITLAAALTFFAQSYRDSLSRSQREMARFIAGADLRIPLETIPQQALDEVEGVEQISTVYRGAVSRSDGRALNLFALDAQTFDLVSDYPLGMTNLSMPLLMSVLQSFNPSAAGEAGQPVIPGIFSADALPPNTSIGDRLELKFFGFPLLFEVRGIIQDFPTVNSFFVITDWQLINSVTDQLLSESSRNWEYWLAISPGERSAILEFPAFAGNILADAGSIEQIYRRNALTMGANRAFSLNALILGLLSVAAFILVSLFAAQERSYEFSILRAGGVSARQVLRLLVGEGLALITLGMAAGAGLGYGLAALMRPYLNQALTRDLPGTVVHRLWFNWPGLSQRYALLLGFYLLAILFLAYSLIRLGITRALRLGDE